MTQLIKRILYAEGDFIKQSEKSIKFIKEKLKEVTSLFLKDNTLDFAMFYFVFEPIILRFYTLKKSAKQANKSMAENVETFDDENEDMDYEG